MIIINKKRIQIILTCILIGAFAFSFQIANNQKEVKENNNLKQENSIQTTATPVSGTTIILDAGHGVPDEGAQSSNRDHRSGN